MATVDAIVDVLGAVPREAWLRLAFCVSIDVVGDARVPGLDLFLGPLDFFALSKIFGTAIVPAIGTRAPGVYKLRQRRGEKKKPNSRERERERERQMVCISLSL